MTQSVQTNAVSVKIPQAWNALLLEDVYFSVWNAEENELRFMTSFATTQDDLKVLDEALLKVGALRK